MSEHRMSEPGTSIGMIWAQTPAGVIGLDGTMPWHLPEDLAHFRRVTSGHPVLMGRRTWESFPAKFRPLPGRTNIVVTRRPGWADDPQAAGAVVVDAPAAGLDAARSAPGGHTVWVLGGGQIYRALIEVADTAVVTVIDTDVDGDTYAPVLDASWHRTDVDPPGDQHSGPEHTETWHPEAWHTGANGTRYRFETWRRHGADTSPSIA